MNIRERRELLEKKTLSPFATLSVNSKGRTRPYELCTIRTIFQQDRDRIIHSKAFRRLKHKTQVFIAPEGDHYRTRLTHTLEVAQIARTIARALLLNEDLTEAIALGHDLGHTPFGHAGEDTLNEICSFGFNHNEQSLRVVDYLEKSNGLNLSWEVRDGILHHSGEGQPETLEARVVHLSDRIAYINHDIDDALRAKVLKKEQLPFDVLSQLGFSHGDRINHMIQDIINNSMDSGDVYMSPVVEKATNQLRDFLFENIYIDSIAKKEEKKAQHILKELYNYFQKNVEHLPEEFTSRLDIDSKERVIIDYIAGMTDRYAINKFYELFIPAPWKV
ncbi:deoxyguanosinetriphosphate triphosphohydrolase [Irregularibacter muris]|uniref:Deoxyguanosinetriphosphate triphosphohydrolase-like protein n=1 Tax=Irregularibacter muris TaxID=1796619 RepID=A0AAE3KZ86_9FIRM|nr:deoxyguanosinetriphosphate triphosphohydrolase [Irregularibacter muris]MCR1897872.1 deoxyguanosinetriphosphate triphosphohydrolase [Irregularibacter muris]